MYVRNQHWNQRFYHPPKVQLDGFLPARGTHWPTFCHCISAFPFLEFHIHGIMRHVLFCVCFLLLSVMFLRFTHFVVRMGSSCSSMAELYSIVWLYLRWFVHFLVEGHLGCVQFSTIRIKAAMNIHMQVCVWTYGHIFSFLLGIPSSRTAG